MIFIIYNTKVVNLPTLKWKIYDLYIFYPRHQNKKPSGQLIPPRVILVIHYLYTVYEVINFEPNEIWIDHEYF